MVLEVLSPEAGLWTRGAGLPHQEEAEPLCCHVGGEGMVEEGEVGEKGKKLNLSAAMWEVRVSKRLPPL